MSFRVTAARAGAPLLLASAALAAHGGTYAGPGSLPAPGAAPATPTAPTAPVIPVAPATPGGGPAPAATLGPDVTTWSVWWEYNKESFLLRKARLYADPGSTTGGSELLTGLGAAGARAGLLQPSADQAQREVVPALLDALEHESNPDLVTACLVALAKIGGDPRIEPALHRALRDDDQEIAETAALSLGILAAESDTDLLLALLRDEDFGRAAAGALDGVPVRTRSFAAYALGMIAAQTSDNARRAFIGASLLRILETDRTPQADLRVACAIALGMAPCPQAAEWVPALEGRLRDPDGEPVVRAQLPVTLARLARVSPAAETEARLLIALLQDRKAPHGVRQSCALALGVITAGGAAYAPEVAAALTAAADAATDQLERHYAALSLVELAADPASAASGLRGAATDFLLRRLESGVQARAEWAALDLGVLAFRLRQSGQAPDPRAAEAVARRFLAEKSPSPKSSAALALGLMQHRPAQDAIRSALQEYRDPDFRGYAALALGLLQARACQGELQGLLHESRRLPNLLTQVALALGLMGDHDVTETLLSLMQPVEGNVPPLATLAAVSAALGYTGDARAVTPLVALLRDRERPALARAFAAVALGRLMDPRPLPWNAPIVDHLNYLAAVPTLISPDGKGVLDIL